MRKLARERRMANSLARRRVNDDIRGHVEGPETHIGV